MNTNRVEKIITQAIKGNELPFNRFVEDLYKSLLPKLMAFTNSKTDAEDIFITSMQKYWERFVIKQEKLPQNSKGYIYTMCKNAWRISIKHPWNKVVLNDDLYEYHILDLKNDDADGVEHKDLRRKALYDALNSLSEKCKALMESELDKSTKLKENGR